jgi:hypothetical protein
VVVLLEVIKQNFVQMELSSAVIGVNFAQMDLIPVAVVDYNQMARTSKKLQK